MTAHRRIGDSGVQVAHGPAWANRYALAPMTNKQSHDDGTLSETEYQWLVARGRGGFAVVKTCAAYIADSGRTWTGQLGIASDEHLPGLTRLASGLQATGTRSLVHSTTAVCAPIPRWLADFSHRSTTLNLALSPWIAATCNRWSRTTWQPR